MKKLPRANEGMATNVPDLSPGHVAPDYGIASSTVDKVSVVVCTMGCWRGCCRLFCGKV